MKFPLIHERLSAKIVHLKNCSSQRHIRKSKRVILGTSVLIAVNKDQNCHFYYKKA
jgi:hypothetical protein